jgi:hypothetical protein
MQRASTRASVATRVAQSGRNFGRASERYVSKRPQCGEQDMTLAVGLATGRVTTCHGDHGRHGAGHVQRRVTAPGHGGHGAAHGIHGAGHSDHGDGERPAGPESMAASGAGAAACTRAGGWDKAEHHLVDAALPDVARFAMLRPIYMLSHVNLTSQSPVWGHILEFWPSLTVFPNPSPGLPSHPPARHYRRYLEVVLLAMLRVNLLPTPRVDRYRGRSLARMRPGDSPGPRQPFVGSGWTRTDRVERVILMLMIMILNHW